MTSCDLNSYFLCDLPKDLRPKKSGKPLSTQPRIGRSCQKSSKICQWWIWTGITNIAQIWLDQIKIGSKWWTFWDIQVQLRLLTFKFYFLGWPDHLKQILSWFNQIWAQSVRPVLLYSVKRSQNPWLWSGQKIMTFCVLNSYFLCGLPSWVGSRSVSSKPSTIG